MIPILVPTTFDCKNSMLSLTVEKYQCQLAKKTKLRKK